MARYRLVAHGRKHGWDMADVDKFTNGRFREIFKVTDYSLSLEERKKMRSSNDYRFTGMTEERRLVFERVPQTPAE
jgi:hypothetical protein